jgi:restriction system protein
MKTYFHPIIALIVLFIFVAWLLSPQAEGFRQILYVVGGIIAIFVVLVGLNENRPEVKQRNEESRKIALARCNTMILKHGPELLRKRRQLTVDKGYGIIETHKWEAEKAHFIKAIIEPESYGHKAEFTAVDWKLKIEQHLDNLSSSRQYRTPPAQGKPIAFENFCADLLECAGWKVSTTKASGDQGADVIAKKNGCKVVLQCKQYSKPVGNASVQEAFAAKAHYGADAAAVVTNASYTKSASALAKSTGVLLLHPEELPNLTSKL